MADEKNLDFKIAFNPVDKSTTFADMGAIKAVWEDLGKFFVETLRQGTEVHTSFIEALKKAANQGGDLANTLELIKELNSDITKEIQPLVKYLEEAVKNGVSLEDAIKGVESQAKKVKQEMESWKDKLSEANTIAKGFATLLEGPAKAYADSATSIVNAILKIGTAAASGSMVGPWGAIGAGIMAGISEIPKLLKGFDEMSKYSAEFNRYAYDTGAALGQQGEKAAVLGRTIANLTSHYYIAYEQSAKIAQSLATIGAKSGEVLEVSDNIAKRYTLWKEITPEYQIKTMSDYMKNFGLTATEADTAFGNIVDRAYALKNSMGATALDIKSFVEQSNQLALSTRQWGYNIEDAGKMLQVATMYVKDVTGGVDTIRAMEIAQTLMTTGLNNMGQMVYVSQMFGDATLKNADIFTQLGSMRMAGTEGSGISTLGRVGMMVDFIQDMGQRVMGGGTHTQEQWGGFLTMLQQGGLMGQTSGEALKKLSGQFAEGLDAESLGEAIEKAQKAFKDAGINTAENTKNIYDVAKQSTSFLKEINSQLNAIYAVIGKDVIEKQSKAFIFDVNKLSMDEELLNVQKAIGKQPSHSDKLSIAKGYIGQAQQLSDPNFVLTEEAKVVQDKFFYNFGKAFRHLGKDVFEEAAFFQEKNIPLTKDVQTSIAAQGISLSIVANAVVNRPIENKRKNNGVMNNYEPTYRGNVQNYSTGDRPPSEP